MPHLIGLLRIYKEREGGKYGANPAVVGFEVTINCRRWHVNCGMEIIMKLNDQLQRMSEGFYHEGLVFFTAEELAAYGAEELAKQFPFGTY